MKKEGYSRKGFFGEIIHYDANGNKIGESQNVFCFLIMSPSIQMV